MRDLITYCKDITKLLAEVETKLPNYLIKDEQGKRIGFAVNKTPTVRKGNKTLSVVRCTAAEAKLFAGLKNITVLANVPAGGDLLADLSKTGRATYDSIYDQTPQDVIDETGKVVGQHTPPELIGKFA